MKKQLVICWITFVLIIVSLSGCDQKNNENPAEKQIISDNFVGSWTPDGYNNITFYSNGSLSYYSMIGSWKYQGGKLVINLSDWNVTVNCQFSDDYSTLNITGLTGSSSKNSFRKWTPIEDKSDIVTIGTTIVSDLHYVNTDLRFGINPPDGWLITPIDSENTPNAVTLSYNSFLGFPPKIVITQTPFELNASVTLNNVVDEMLKIYPNATKTETTINGRDAYEIMYPSYNYFNYNIKHKEVWVGAYEKIFILAYHATEDDYLNYLSIVDDSINSFTIFEGKTSFDWSQKLNGYWVTPPVGDLTASYSFSYGNVRISYQEMYFTMELKLTVHPGQLILTDQYIQEGTGATIINSKDTYNFSFFNNNYMLKLTKVNDKNSEIILVKESG